MYHMIFKAELSELKNLLGIHVHLSIFFPEFSYRNSNKQLKE